MLGCSVVSLMGHAVKPSDNLIYLCNCTKKQPARQHFTHRLEIRNYILGIECMIFACPILLFLFFYAITILGIGPYFRALAHHNSSLGERLMSESDSPKNTPAVTDKSQRNPLWTQGIGSESFSDLSTPDEE